MKFTSLYTRLAILLLSAGVICGGVIAVKAVDAKTNGKSGASVNELIDQASEKGEKNDFPSLTKNLSQGGNIYDMSYNLAKHQSLE